jgi:NAD(P)-dependent dehydrogenase (short-subunit alcohol dehydrogenase family)
MTSSLAGRAAIVTGGASGLGRAIALRLAREGVNVCLMSLTRDRKPRVTDEVKYFASDDDLEQTRQAVEATGVRSLALDGDVSQPADAERLVAEAVEAFGRLDILVNNAATNVVHEVLGHDDAAWLRVILVNLYGPYLCARAALPHLIANGWGRIVSIGSTNAHVGTAYYSAYAASKHGLLGFNRSLALEVAQHNITANTISPGFIETPSAQMHIRWFADKEGVSYETMREKFLNQYPQKRFIQPEEIAELVAYLCRDEAQAITGEDIAITTGASW